MLAVEKDYWVTTTHRGMAAQFPGSFVFKGGTSSTKGWRIGARFSEDIDILVVQRPDPDCTTGRDRVLKAICEAGAAACGAEPERLPGGRASIAPSASRTPRTTSIPAADARSPASGTSSGSPPPSTCVSQPGHATTPTVAT